MASIRYRDREGTGAGAVFVAVGALAGLAAGVLLAQRYGGLSGLGARVRDRVAAARGEERDGDQRPTGYDVPEYEDEPLAAGDRGTDEGDMDEGEELEERVLEAFRNDPVLSERAVDIGAVGAGVIELSGWVHSDEESHHAMTVTRGVPGIATVVNRLEVRDEESRLSDNARRYESGETETSPRWEGGGVGIGRPRQGVSTEGARHVDPKPLLEDRWQSQAQSVRAAADDIEGLAERRERASAAIEGDETGGSPIAPSGVPKGDHVADPASAEPFLREQTGRVDRNLRGE
jgi:hypothetical protein